MHTQPFIQNDITYLNKEETHMNMQGIYVTLCLHDIESHIPLGYQSTPIPILSDTLTSRGKDLSVYSICPDELAPLLEEDLGELTPIEEGERTGEFQKLDIRVTCYVLDFELYRMPILALMFYGTPFLFICPLYIHSREFKHFIKEATLFNSDSVRFKLQDQETAQLFDIDLKESVCWSEVLDNCKSGVWYDYETFEHLMNMVNLEQLAEDLAITLIEG